MKSLLTFLDYEAWRLKSFILFASYELIKRLPLMLLMFGGIIFAIVRRDRHARVSMITTIALVFFLVESYTAANVLYHMPEIFRTYGYLIYLFDNFSFAPLLILLTAAALSGRTTPNTVEGTTTT